MKGATRPQHRQSNLAEPQMLQRARTERAIHALLSADNWEATYATLLQERETLLTDEALSVLRDYIAQARQRDRTGQMANYLEAHRVLLERARTLGIDAAWGEFRDSRLNADDAPPEGEDPETQAVIGALRTLLATESWNDTYAIMERERDRLLSDTAEQFLSALIQVARQDSTPQANEGVRYLELHQTLLRETRRIGLAAAWEHFHRDRRALEAELSPTRAAPSDPVEEALLPDAARALRTLLNSRSWPESHQIIEHDQGVLLTDATDRLLDQLLQSARKDPDPQSVRGVVYLGLHLRLLRAARRKGLDQAWADFEDALKEAHVIPDDVPPPLIESPSPPPAAPEPLPPAPPTKRVVKDATPAEIAEAVAAFLGASSWVVARAILEERQGALLTDRAIRLINEQADALRKHANGRDLYAARLLHLQAQLLRRAQQVGLDRAWAEFEAERD